VAGCYVPKSDLVNEQTTNRVLVEQNRAYLAQIDNLKVHSHDVENQLIRAEHELAARDQADPSHAVAGTDGSRLGLPNGRRLPAAVNQQLALWAQQYPNLSFDAETGVSKCDIDVLFDSGQAELRPAARQMLVELAQVLQRSEAKDLKIMVVGHTDNQRIVSVSMRDKYPNNFHLSTARALAVVDVLRGQGLNDQRIGIAGFGSHEPVADNQSAVDRQKNRRVEIFVMPHDVPVVGWGESRPDALY
jgi:outer membrane protein OmpA-like peptidoglycan-associated protein